MNKTTRRKRTVLRIRWRERNRGGITQREYLILQETKFFRTLRVMFPEAQTWQIHSAIRSMNYGRVSAVLRPVPYSRGHHPDLVVHDEVPLNFEVPE